jgi:hypothetical protein
MDLDRFRSRVVGYACGHPSAERHFDRLMRWFGRNENGIGLWRVEAVMHRFYWKSGRATRWAEADSVEFYWGRNPRL